jgi:hypothetical protein
MKTETEKLIKEIENLTFNLLMKNILVGYQIL